MPRRRAVAALASYEWIFDLLFATGSTVTWAAAGQLPPGYERADRYAALPAIAGRRFVVSLADRRGTSSALTSYNALRTVPRRVVRDIFSAGLRTGVAQPLARTKIDVGVAVGATARQRADDLLTEHLREVLGCEQVMIAFGGGGGPYRKPVLQVFGTDGTPLAYVKVGWNDWTRDAVRREAAALRTCAARPMRLGVPRLIRHSVWQGLDLLITAPLPSGVHRVALGADITDVSMVREISELSAPYAGELAGSPWWQDVRTRIAGKIADPATRAQLETAADDVERRYGRAALEFGTWHGDFVPWNVALLGDRLYAWDWESCSAHAPLGFDVLHYYFQVAFVVRHRDLATAAETAGRRAAPALAELGIGPDAATLTGMLHLFELFIRHEEARSSADGIDGRFYPAVTDVLARSLAAPLRASGLDRAERAA